MQKEFNNLLSKILVENPKYRVFATTENDNIMQDIAVDSSSAEIILADDLLHYCEQEGLSFDELKKMTFYLYENDYKPVSADDYVLKHVHAEEMEA